MPPHDSRTINAMRPMLKYLLAVTLLLAGCDRPDFHTLAGESGSFSQYRGRWLVINYWAQWCPPCIEEIPQLQLLADRFPRQLQVLMVNFDGVQGAQLRAQAQELNIQLPVVLEDPGPLLGLPRPRVLPTTYLVDPTGCLHAKLEGPQDLESLQTATGLAMPRPTSGPQLTNRLQTTPGRPEPSHHGSAANSPPPSADARTSSPPARPSPGNCVDRLY